MKITMLKNAFVQGTGLLFNGRDYDVLDEVGKKLVDSEDAKVWSAPVAKPEAKPQPKQDAGAEEAKQ